MHRLSGMRNKRIMNRGIDRFSKKQEFDPLDMKNQAKKKKKKVKKKKVTKKGSKKGFTEVIVRFRPLLHGEKRMINGVPVEPNQDTFLELKAEVNGRKKTYKYKGFTKIFTEDETNEDVFNFSLRPYLEKDSFGTFCMLGFGHSGSGKTHSLIGYDELGNFQQSVDQLLDRIGDNSEFFLNLSCAEIYNEKIYDLLTKKKKKLCSIRDNGSGEMVIRSETMIDKKKSKLRIEGLVGRRIKDSKGAMKALKLILKRRRAGNSAVHSQSSRSHAILVLEVVNQETLDARESIIQEESNLLPMQRMLMDILKKKMKFFKTVDGKKRPIHSYEVRNNIEKQKKIIAQLIKEEKNAVKKGKEKFKLHTNKVLFCDLCGADFEGITMLGKETQKESIQINKGLFALKECIKSIALNKPHIPFRNSTLTIALKKYLLAENSHVVMLATASPSIKQLTGTLNTLKYSKLFSETV